MAADKQDIARKNRRAAFIIFAVVAGMVGLSFASVPLYRMFCQATGLGGQAYQAQEGAGKILERTVLVRFNTDVSPNLPWDFKSDQAPLKIRIGQEAAISFSATNRGNKPAAGTAIYNVLPEIAGKYFHKTQCFCFNYQLIAAHESAHFPVVFYIDPAMDADRELDDVKTITLSYSFFPADTPEMDKALEDFYNGKKSGTTSIKIER